MRWPGLFLWSLVVATSVLVACADFSPPDFRPVLENAESLRIFSLQPFNEMATDFDPASGFHGHEVLGSIEIEDASTRKKFTEALIRGIDDSHWTAGCFIPRHGVRAVAAGRTLDLLICFQCSNNHVFLDGEPIEGTGITRDTQGLFKELLTRANVPLANPKTIQGKGTGFF